MQKNTKPYRKPARHISQLMEKILEPVLARRSGMTLDLIGAWADIVGEQYYQTTQPIKINWPRKSYEDDPFKPGELLVACEPSHALFFQHELGVLVEKINVFFGYAAIKNIRIQQKTVRKANPNTGLKKRKLTKTAKSKMQDVLEHIDDPQLRKSLAKLGKGVYSKRASNLK